MRKKSEIANHRRQVPSGLGRRASLPPRAYAGEFLLAHLVAFHYAILHPIPGGDGFHDFRSFATRTASPRKAVHTFHCRRREIVHIACRARRAQASMREKVWETKVFLTPATVFLRQEPLYPTPRMRASERHSVEADLSAAWEKPSFLPSSQPRSI